MTSLPAEPNCDTRKLKLCPMKRERFCIWLLIALTGSLLLARLSVSEPLSSANDRSRWCTVWSLGTRGTYIIDEIIQYPGWDSIDKVRHEEHFYSTKPPLYPTLVAGLYVLIRNATGMTLAANTQEVTQLILFLVNILPFLVAMYVWWRMLVRLDFSAITRMLVISFIGLATLLTPFLTSLNNHTPAATCLMFALAAAVFILTKKPVKACHTNQENIVENDKPASGWLYAISGFFAAWTCCHELPAALFGLAIFAVLARHDWKKTAIWFVPAALIPIVGFVVTTFIATGSWKPFYMYYGTEKYVYEHLGIPSYWSVPRGLDKAEDTVAEYVFHCLIGHHGIFSLTPLLLLCIPGYWWGIRQRSGALKILHLMGVFLTVAILLFYWKRTENYNYGGVSVALRWVLWLTPFWLLALAEWLERQKNLRVLMFTLILLGVPSVYSVWEPWRTAWQQPWLFKQMTNMGWIDYSDKPDPLPRPVRSWVWGMPETENANPDYWSEFRDGNGNRMKISDGGPMTVGEKSGRLLIVENARSGGEFERTRRFVIDPDSLFSGKEAELFLLDWTDDQPEASAASAREFLSGVPAKANYRPGRFRYLFTPIQENAIHCLNIATRIVQPATDDLSSQEYRCDLWLNENYPFGLIQLQTSVTDLKQRMLVSRTNWTLIKTGLHKNSQENSPPN